MSSNDDKAILIAKLQALCLQRFGVADAWPELFDAYDLDHDGLATRAEVSKLLKDADVGNAWSRGHWVTGVLLAVDQDVSGAISRAELENAMRTLAPPQKTGRHLSDDEARAIATLLLSDSSKRINPKEFSPEDLQAIAKARKALAPSLGVAPNPAPPIPIRPNMRIPNGAHVATVTPAPRAAVSTFGEQLVLGLLVGGLLLAFQRRSSGRRRG